MRWGFLIFPFLLGGCLTNMLNTPPATFDEKSPGQIFIEVRGDAFDPTRTHLGPEISFRESTGLLGYTDYRYRMRGIASKTVEGLITHQLYVDIAYPADWRWYRSAHLIGGKSLMVRDINSRVGSCGPYTCSLEETIGITIPAETLAELNGGDLNVKISAKSGHGYILRVPAPYMTAYMRSVSPTSSSAPQTPTGP